MKKKVDEATKEIEATNLLNNMKLNGFDQNHAAFAAMAKRTRAELKQHLTKERPIPLTAVKAYAAILKCSIRDISPRWADELTVSDQPNVGIRSKISILPVFSPTMQELIDIASSLNERGLIELIVRAKDIAQEQSRKTKQTPESSQ